MNFLFQSFRFFFPVLQIFLGQIMKVFHSIIAKNIPGILTLLHYFLIFSELGYNLRQFCVFFGQFAPFILICNHRRVAQLIFNAQIAGFHSFQFLSLHLYLLIMLFYILILF